jgi:hypothetical protein
VEEKGEAVPYVRKDVSVGPGAEAVPVTGRPSVAEGPGARPAPVVEGLAARARDPETMEPLEDPQGLVGERPATGSMQNPG